MTSEIEWRRRWKPDLAAKPWKPFVIHGNNYLVKFLARHDSYEFLMTDYIWMWYETLGAEGIKKRSAKLNPSVEAHVSKLLDHIKEYVDNPNKKAEWDADFKNMDVDDVDKGDQLVLSLTTKLAGLPFSWKFKALPDNTGMYKEHLTLPLMVMFGELQRQNAELVKILRNKDKEIDDYKAQGTRVTRKHLETAPFDETAFKNSALTSKGFTENVKLSDSKTFDSDGQELYQTVMTTHAWLNRDPEEDEEGESLMDEGETLDRGGDRPSWESRVPLSLASGAATPKNSPVKSTQNSPAKSPKKSPARNIGDSQGKAPDTSPNTKDTELLRRQALERRLQEEMEKKEQKAKKKKKLKL